MRAEMRWTNSKYSVMFAPCCAKTRMLVDVLAFLSNKHIEYKRILKWLLLLFGEEAAWFDKQKY